MDQTKKELKDLIFWWRAASNVLSEADGDGPVRSSLRQCAKQLEDVLAKVADDQDTEDIDRLRSLLTCGGCGIHYGDEGYLEPCPNAHRETCPHEWQTKRETRLLDALVEQTALAERLKENSSLWQAITAITDSLEGVSVTIRSPSRDFFTDETAHSVIVDYLRMSGPRTLYGNDRLELLKEAKRLVEVAEEYGGKE